MYALLVNQALESRNRARYGAAIILHEELELWPAEWIRVNLVESQIKPLLHQLAGSRQVARQRQHDPDGKLAALIGGRLSNGR